MSVADFMLNSRLRTGVLNRDVHVSEPLRRLSDALIKSIQKQRETSVVRKKKWPEVIAG